MSKLRNFIIVAFLCFVTVVMAQTANDRPLFDVTGSVKTIKSKSGNLSEVIECQSVTFSKTGAMTKINGVMLAMHGTKITSRTNGLPTKARLTMIDDAGETPYDVSMRYNAKHKLVKASSAHPMDDYELTFSYDAAGRVKSMEIGSSIEGRLLTYKYISFDTKGNWTKRSVVIKYFSCDANGKKRFIDSMTERETEIRTITYY